MSPPIQLSDTNLIIFCMIIAHMTDASSVGNYPTVCTAVAALLPAGGNRLQGGFRTVITQLPLIVYNVGTSFSEEQQGKNMADDRSPQAGAEQYDLSLTDIISAFDVEDALAMAGDSDELAVFDPNATMNYQEAGVSYPEFPFVDEDPNGSQEPSQSASMAGRSFSPVPSSRLDAIPLQQTIEDTQQTSAHSALNQQREAQKSFNSSTARSQRQTYTAGNSSTTATYYRPLTGQQSTYKIRGGGATQKLDPRSPVLIIAAVVLLIIGMFIFSTIFNNLSSSLSNVSIGATFELTPEQTREAIDSRTPFLLSYVDVSIDDTVAAITETGQFVYGNDRYQPDSPDVSAAGRELVSMPQEMSEEQMLGYYEGSYSAYSPEEIAQYFNGSYVLDMARGELGSWTKLKYVNLNALSIEDEMAHLAEIQQLTGDTVTITDQGTDSRGNVVIQGQKVIDGERILYFKIASCSFNDIYAAQTLAGSSVYITCTLATYDFYTGSDTITPA